MIAKRRPGHPARITYKCEVALFPGEWDEMKMEAQARNISGGELISAVLSQYIEGLPKGEDVPIPQEAPEDA